MANIVTVHRYAGASREIANRIKNAADDHALQMAADEMAPYVPEMAALIPAPSSSGKNRSMLALAEYISQVVPDSVVIEAVARVVPMPSKVLLRRAGQPLPTLDAQVASMRLVEAVPSDRPLWIVDNVVTSGETIRAIETLIGRPVNAIVYADAGRGRRPELGGAQQMKKVAGRICVSGSRGYRHLENVDRILEMLPKIVVVHGGAAGVDARADEAARAIGLEVDVWKADWERYGRRAGPLRNRQMVASCDFLYAFWDGLSRGTASAIQAAVDQDVPFEIVEDV